MFENFELSRSQCNGNETEFRLTQQQEWNLDFSRMLATMRCRVFLQCREAFLQSCSEFGIEGNVAQRRLPGAFAHHGERAAHPGMVRAEHDATLGHIDAGKDRACHMPGI